MHMESRQMVLMNLSARAVIEMQTYRTDLWTQGEGEGKGRTNAERVAWKHTHCHM